MSLGASKNMFYLVIVGAIIALTHVKLTKEHVYLSTRGESGVLAQVVWKKKFPYVGVSAFLVVRYLVLEKSCRVLLLENRDHFLDITKEINDISWDDGKILLDVSRKHYNGPSSFQVSTKGINNDEQCLNGIKTLSLYNG